MINPPASKIAYRRIYLILKLLIVSRMNHEVALRMLAHRADFRSFLAYNDMTAVRTLPHHILVA